MKVLKPEHLVDECHLWQHDTDQDSNIFESVEKTTLVFGIFYLDKMILDITQELEKVYTRLKKLIFPWNKYYPWNQYNGIQVRITKNTDGLPYIFGSLCVEDYAEQEESLVVGLLHKLSGEWGPQLLIKVCDTDGDFLMIECSKEIPEEYEYPVGNNRLWLHEGKFKMIPVTYYYNRGITMNESLDFLERAYFKCIEIPEISKKLQEKMLDGFPEKYLNNLLKFPIAIQDERHYKILQCNPQLISLVLKNILDERITLGTTNFQGRAQELEVLAPSEHCNFLSTYLHGEKVPFDKSEVALLCGQLVSKSLLSLIDNQLVTIEESTQCSVVDPASLNSALNDVGLLQGHFNFKDTRLDKPLELEDDIEPTEKLISSLNSFFADSNAGLYGVNNRKEDGIDSDAEESDVDEDEEVQKYFERENIDIDEDDFFEYFLVEALKVKKDDLEEYRGEVKDPADEETHNSEEEGEMLQEFEQILKQSAGGLGDVGNLEHLFESLQVDGAINGPLQTILRNLGTKD